ncbi:MAG: pantoate--beta-alanine ligase [Acidobacteriia bacterium]|nr:pantoate--beta-alanine ligase [Terriglobia bacterium]
MDIVRRVHSMKEMARQGRERARRIGFVPTMGYLHEGHMSLVRRVKEMADLIVVSIFVNPTQFGPGEDYANYPRDLARDADRCVSEGVDVVFAPEADEIYAADACTFVEVEGLSARLEGASRPGHFRGVATVVLKLLNIVQPHVVAFGQKDAQQAVIVQRMTRDLLLDTEILVVPIVRDADGVALSSRNVRLASAERRAAQAIPRGLKEAEKAIEGGERDPGRIVKTARDVLEAEPILRVDYVELVDTARLQPVAIASGEMLLAVAVYAGKTRLIDNIVVTP